MDSHAPPLIACVADSIRMPPLICGDMSCATDCSILSHPAFLERLKPMRFGRLCIDSELLIDLLPGRPLAAYAIFCGRSGPL